MTHYKVVYASQTGNTALLAQKIYDAIDDPSKDIERLTPATTSQDASTYFVGFWVDRGSCCPMVMDFLDSLIGKNVVLFGTCGMGSDELYYHKVSRTVSGLIPAGNNFVGTYLCQGKMPMKVRQRYEQMLEDKNSCKKAQYLIRNFDEALLHPDVRDLACAEGFVRKMLSTGI